MKFTKNNTKVICMTCKTHLKGPRNAKYTSDGICKPCKAEMMKEIEALQQDRK